jgi:hypothetical protein
VVSAAPTKVRAPVNDGSAGALAVAAPATSWDCLLQETDGRPYVSSVGLSVRDEVRPAQLFG